MDAELLRAAFKAGFNTGCMLSNVESLKIKERGEKCEPWYQKWSKKKGIITTGGSDVRMEGEANYRSSQRTA